MAHIKSFACALGLLLAAQTASARDLPFRTTMAAKSAASGVVKQGQRILERKAGPGRSAIFDRALRRVLALPSVQAVGGEHKLVSENNVTLAKAPTWSLEVRGDGDWIRFLNEAYITSPQNSPRPVELAMADSDAESLAREIVSNELAPLVTLRDGETLQAWTTSNLISVVGEVSSGNEERAIYASRITLTRVINGVPVLGAGSKITVEVANDGTLVGFDIDWSQLVATTRTTTLLDTKAIRERAKQLAPSSLGDSPREVGFECGYYDTGAWFERSSVVQPGCLVVYEEDPTSHHQIAVPAGSTVIKDATWVESTKFAK